MNSTARRWEGGQTMVRRSYVKGGGLSLRKPVVQWYAVRPDGVT